MSRDEFFDNLFGESAPAAEEIKRLRQQAYEERVIKYVFTECGVKPPSWGRLAMECRNATGQVKLHFDWFNSAYKFFPARLVGKRIPYIHKITLPELFKPATKNKLVRAITKRLADFELDPANDGYVFVFPLIRTKFCAHSLLSPTADGTYVSNADSRAQFVLQINGVKRPMRIEPLKSFCRGLGATWFSE